MTSQSPVSPPSAPENTTTPQTYFPSETSEKPQASNPASRLVSPLSPPTDDTKNKENKEDIKEKGKMASHVATFRPPDVESIAALSGGPGFAGPWEGGEGGGDTDSEPEPEPGHLRRAPRLREGDGGVVGESKEEEEESEESGEGEESERESGDEEDADTKLLEKRDQTEERETSPPVVVSDKKGGEKGEEKKTVRGKKVAFGDDSKEEVDK
ncbi:hypothetical protein HYFRA_00011988 [Hymenoscyphus fraxineus]|uniref:Uncharacterized protein n=1 Tax=Hymenoscyphus fraxineus TaxID=746836 RepID=A0A9N9L2F4_9HELO|nr:hypothetical protein HYFRA_00011988 [Hymenoscyphus fraxineus]